MTNLFEILRTLLIKSIFCSLVTDRERERERERERKERKYRKERRPRKEEIRNKCRKEE